MAEKFLSAPAKLPGETAQGYELEIIQPTSLESITKAEIDTQIATAHRYPRSMQVFKQRATDMATFDEHTAESCIYVRPVGKKDGVMQYAEGLSVRMAEIVGASYGNLRVGSMIVEQTDRYVVTRGYAHDLESNFACSSEVKEPTVTKQGQPFSEGMRAVIAKAALSKARRDATFQVVPKALCRPIEIEVRKLIAGDAKSLATRIESAVSYVQRLNIEPERVWAALGIAGKADLTSDLLLTLTGIRNSIKDGDSTIDDAFPPVATKPVFKEPQAILPPSTAGVATTATSVTAVGAVEGNLPRDTSSSNEGSPAPTRVDSEASAPRATTAPAASNNLADDQLLRGLLDLASAAKVTEAEVETYAKAKGLIPAEKDLTEMRIPRLRQLIDGFATAAQTIIATRPQSTS